MFAIENRTARWSAVPAGRWLASSPSGGSPTGSAVPGRGGRRAGLPQPDPRSRNRAGTPGRGPTSFPRDVQVRAAVLNRVVDKYGLPEGRRGGRTALGAGDPMGFRPPIQRQAGLSGLAEAEVRPLSRRERFSWWRRGPAAGELAAILARLRADPDRDGRRWHPRVADRLCRARSGRGDRPAGRFGVLNTLTVAALVESITRDGRMRYGDAFFGRLIGDYLGRPGNLVAMPALLAFDAVGFCVALVGFGTTLAAATGLPVLAAPPPCSGWSWWSCGGVRWMRRWPWPSSSAPRTSRSCW